MLRVGWFSSGRDEAARNLLIEVWERKERGELDIIIPFVFCNRDRGEKPGSRWGKERELFFELVDHLGIELVNLSHTGFEPELRAQGLRETTDHAHPSPALARWRELYGRRVIEALDDAGVEADLCVLAGYMLIWSEAECERYDGINLHPALPWGPTGTWQEVIWELLAEGASEQGVMMHLVSPELDRGPPVAYCRFPITGADWDPLWAPVKASGAEAIKVSEGESNILFRRVRAEGELRELPLIAHTIGEFATSRLFIKDGRPYRSGEMVESGADLTELIEGEVAGGGGP
jgi:phosphoribosylglycinamide formyltransferase-1